MAQLWGRRNACFSQYFYKLRFLEGAGFEMEFWGHRDVTDRSLLVQVERLRFVVVLADLPKLLGSWGAAAESALRLGKALA